MRTALVVALTLAMGATALAQAPAPAPRSTQKTFPVGAGSMGGQPTFEEGKATGYFIWTDKEGLHVRWTTDGKPALFTGRLDLDKPLKEVKRVREEAAGWVNSHGNRIVMFSATSRKELDGFDLSVPGGRRVQLDLKINGADPIPEQVSFGRKSDRPKGFPLTLNLR